MFAYKSAGLDVRQMPYLGEKDAIAM